MLIQELKHKDHIKQSRGV